MRRKLESTRSIDALNGPALEQGEFLEKDFETSALILDDANPTLDKVT